MRNLELIKKTIKSLETLGIQAHFPNLEYVPAGMELSMEEMKKLQQELDALSAGVISQENLEELKLKIQ